MTLEMGSAIRFAFKAFANESLCQILLFRGNQRCDAIGNPRLVKQKKTRGIEPPELGRSHGIGLACGGARITSKFADPRKERLDARVAEFRTYQDRRRRE